MADVNFFLKDTKKDKTSLYVIIRYRGKRFKAAVGLTVETEYWDISKHRCKKVRQYPDHVFINAKLEKYYTKLKELFNSWEYEDYTPSTDEFKTQFEAIKNNSEAQKNSFCNYALRFVDNAKISPGTKRGYHSSIKLIQRFEKEKGIELTFDKINLQFYKDFQTWMQNTTYEKASGKGENKTIEHRNYSLNYFGSVIKRIKTIMEDASETFVVPEDYKKKKFKKYQEESDKIYLTYEELVKIHRYTPTIEDLKTITSEKREYHLRKKAKAIQHDKNAFLIGAFTLQRVSDYSRIKDFNIKGDFIRYKPIKGESKNEDVIIPMHWIIREIIESGFDLNKKTYDQKINNHIKEVCKILEFDEKIPVTTTEGFEQVQRIYPKWQLVQTHTARRSGATNMMLQGIPTNVIMKLGGWKSEKSFWKYIKIDNQQNAEMIKEHPFFNGD